MQTGITYTEVKLCTYENDLKKAWFVYFDVTNHDTGEVDRVQKRGTINSYKTIKERLAAGAAAVALWKGRVKTGWHRFEIKEPKTANKLTQMNSLTLVTGINWAIDNLDVQPGTKKEYKCTARFIITAAAHADLLFSKIPITEITPQHILLLMDEVKTMRKWSNKAYNRNAGFLSAIFSVLKRKKIIQINPANDISRKPTVQTKKYLPYTEEEKKTIAQHFYTVNFQFLVVWITIYFIGIRPKEILSLKIKDIDLNNRLITIYPDLEAENSKNRKIRYMPIADALLPFLLALNLHKYPSHYYVFGSTYEPGKGCKGAFRMGYGGVYHPDFFKPSLQRVKRDTATKFWNKEVKVKMGINKYFYAAKHTGGNAMILAGIDIEALKEVYGHSSVLVTKNYIDQVLAVNRSQIITKTPNFFSDGTISGLLPAQQN